jgi:hypothetical protein
LHTWRWRLTCKKLCPTSGRRCTLKALRAAFRFASPYTLGRPTVIQEWRHRHCNNKWWRWPRYQLSNDNKRFQNERVDAWLAW